MEQPSASPQTYRVAEIFHSVQGEGVYFGTPMTFIRFVGCSVGKKICAHCDTDFDREYEWRGGGKFSISRLLDEVRCNHVLLTGGEPLDQDLEPLLAAFRKRSLLVHIETSGTVFASATYLSGVWVTVSPKPGYLHEVLERANEIKVIVPGLGPGDGWPTLEDALAFERKYLVPVFLQPRNAKHEVDKHNLQFCSELVMRYPQLRLSPQVHKFLNAR